MDEETMAPVDEPEAHDAVEDEDLVAYRGPTNDVILCS